MNEISVTIDDNIINTKVEDININITTNTQGPAGPATRSSYQHNQNTASDVWTVSHNLDYSPNITVIDTAGSVLIGFGLEYVDSNTLKIYFAGETTGTAFLS